MNDPEYSKVRIYCDICGSLPESGKHTNIVCRVIDWLDRW